MFARKALAVALMTTAALSASFGVVKAASVADWQTAIARTVASKQVYPRSAMMRQLEGSARVKVVMDRTGAIQSYEILQPTGHNVLDSEIERLMGRVNPLPKPPAELSDDRLTIILPLNWTLQ
ncbi:MULTISPECIES: TonB family protein [Iodidimonas]|uniref:TonB C-terminal domain-containing protein n=1 Tax=Iodidimonas nitroreducens TaxID=1236968 RepID=A0A5A7N7I3_9PROT|nr:MULTISPECIES: TonB family protein [Iodidimonas]GAK34458.1 protein TonB [alpha proteobacterium Q-1]GER04058.1 hypothetical protein JCM17846_17400 [Iodidimonas nitroreducens]